MNENTVKNIEKLPSLKPTISIIDAGFDYWHDKVWILYDKVSNKYFYLGRFEYEIISNWGNCSIEEIVEKVNHDSILNIKDANVEHVFKFLLTNNLLQVSSQVLEKIKQGRKNYITTFVKNAAQVFFYRIPLVKPDRFLERTKHLIKPIFGKNFFYCMVILLFIDIYLLASNWGSFSGSIPPFTNFTSVILIMGTLVFTKIIHELGHAYACRLGNCSVPEMGVTFIFFYPLLYTDVSNSMLLDAKKRLIISTAGIRLEIYLAVIAGFLWFFTQDGSALKNLLFFIASISWLVSIMVNIVPFIRFDGYYILSDFLNIRNLGMRATAIFKYYSRRYLFGIDSMLPESYQPKKYRFLLGFSILTGVYKVFLFTGILLFLYYVEVLGIVLFALGVASLLLTPLIRELYNIWILREKMRTIRNFVFTLIGLGLIIALIFIPIGNNIYMPAVLFAKTQRVYTPFEAKIDSMVAGLGTEFKKGDTLITLSNPKLSTEKMISLMKLETEKYYSAGVLLSEKTRQAISAKKSDIEYQQTISDNLDIKSKQLKLVAPFDGKVTAIKEQLYSNIWLSDKAWILDIVDFNTYTLQAFIAAEEINNFKVTNNSKFIFIPDRVYYKPCEVKIKSVSREPITDIPKKPQIPLSLAKSTVVNSNLLLFASNFGGTINLGSDDENNWVPVDSFYTIELDLDKSCKYDNQQIIKGVVKVQGTNESIATKIYNSIKNKIFRYS